MYQVMKEMFEKTGHEVSYLVSMVLLGECASVCEDADQQWR